ncbi:envoplakin a [Corythoichthys intestinalis]|uniref:envoplakin a n=1 Tax=Corythoichthys intestinalis TaxID=161448 RepID=UPI0025A62C06|nr:envoplakin a [Corythoichthys intestinalis]XP_061791818.1 envoplakin-like [Nerophis lumbriciformis]
MFRKKESSVKVNRTQPSNLALLIAQMQKNADVVEKDILRSEELLAEDAENDKKELPLKHQNELCDTLGEAESLLEDLFLDVDKAKKLKHPQAREIESDVLHLHERWLKDCTFYRDIYEQIDDVSLMPRIDWAPVFNEKQKQVGSDVYGPTMPELEKQIASHRLLHQQIEAYNSQLCVSSAGTKENYMALKKQYNKLLETSKWRGHYLNSLYEYMQGCNKELVFLGEEQDKIKKQDWSDRMADPPDVRRQYENFKNNSLLSHESEVNKLQDEGDRLIELKHPASATIQTQRDAVRNEWQKFLHLCICQETHLDNLEQYKKYQMDADQLSETLNKLNSSLDPKLANRKSNSEMMLQLETEEKALQDSEKLLADLRKRSTTIAPLKQRRTPPNRTVTLESLCDWESNRGPLSRGEKCTLKSNSDNENWDVINNKGVANSFPGVCFMIPPPDPEAINRVDVLGGELGDIKKRRAALAAELKNHKSEMAKSLQSAPVSSPTLDPKLSELGLRLDKLNSDLDRADKDMLGRMRLPLSNSNPTSDLLNRLKEQEQAARALKGLEQEKLSAKAELQPLLAKDPSASFALPIKLNNAENKYDGLSGLSDLYNRKANASLNLENQIKKVDGLISGFEERLSEDGPILDVPNSIRAASDSLHQQRKAVASAQPEMRKLSQDLEATEQLCSSLQQGYQEFCPDIQRQRKEVKQLHNRYANLENQLKERENILQEAGAKNQEFQSSAKSLNMFLNNLPKNKFNYSDDANSLNAMQSSQERVMDDLKRKGNDMDRVTDLSKDLQNLLGEYDANIEKFNGTLEDAGATVPKRPYTLTLEESVQKEERDLVNRYAEALAENGQWQKQMGLTRNLLLQNDEKVQMLAQHQVQLESQQRNAFELNNVSRELEDERERTLHVESNLKAFRDRMMSLKNRRGVERVEEKEVLQYYRDPKLETDLTEFQKTLHEEIRRRTTIHSELDIYNKKISLIDENIKNTAPKLLTREVTEFEKDPQLDIEAVRLRDEISRLRDSIRITDSEHIQMRTEFEILQQKKPLIKERIVKKEVVKVEKDPEMLRSLRVFETELSEETSRVKIINDEIFQLRSQINALERMIPNIQPKIITKEVKKVEQDPELISESKRIRSSVENEIVENNSLSKELLDLHSRYREVQALKPKFEVKEIVNEIFRIDPNTEVEILRLRKDIQEFNSQRSVMERDITKVGSEVNFLRSQKPKVEMKEVLQEVVKEERSPENVREIQRLNDQVNIIHNNYNFLQDQVRTLKKERDVWKAEKSKIETKILTRDVIKYEPDPLLEKEADRLRRDLRDEAQRRRSIEELVFDLKNKYILLERQRPEEKVVVQEVVRLQKDPRQVLEHERLGRSLDEEVTSRRHIELELQQLRTKVEEKERLLKASDEHQKRIIAESELKELRLRIHQLEHAPPAVSENIVVEEVLKVERDPKLERLTIGLRAEMDKETNDILRLQRDIRNITLRLEVLQKEKSVEKKVYKEVVRVEKDQAVENERDRLREQVSKQKFARQDTEDQIKRLSTKTTHLMTSKSSNSREETSLTLNRDALLREKDNLTRELRTLEAKKHDINLSFEQQSRLMSERTQMSRQRSIKMGTDIQQLEREILNEKEKIHLRDSTLRDLLLSMQKEEQTETRTKETNVSTKITILDPDTGKDMSPYDAYVMRLIDRQQYIHLQELECDWEEITSVGPDGETSVLQDRKSGSQYSIKEAMKEGRLTQYDLDRYKQGKLHISEFALLVAGETKPKNQYNSFVQRNSTPVKSAPVEYGAIQTYPIAGIVDTHTDTCFTVRSAAMRKLIDATTAQKLLEAQAATGGIIDIASKDRHSVHKAASRGLIDDSQLQRLLNAQKAYTGVEDPVTRERLSVGEASQKGWMPKENATWYMEAQHLTGGLIDPNNNKRVSILDAIGSKMIDSQMMREIQAESNYKKDITDPLTKQKINYKQALDRCKRDPISGLLMLPASSKESGYTPAYNRYARF